MSLNIYPNEQVAVFIDGANLHASIKALDFEVDYQKLLRLFQNDGRLVRMNYYTALMEGYESSPMRPLIDWLDYNGYTLVTKPAKAYTDIFGVGKIKGNMDIELAIDLMEMRDHIDHAFLFSGDGDFCKLLQAVQRHGVRVSVISTIKTNPPMASDELRRQADQYIDLSDIKTLIGRLQD